MKEMERCQLLRSESHKYIFKYKSPYIVQEYRIKTKQQKQK